MTSVICDLDGVVYSDSELIPRSDTALRRLVTAGVELWFATNNSTRSPVEVVAKIKAIAGIDIPESQIVTSSQAAVEILGDGPGPALVIGGNGILEALGHAGIAVTKDPDGASVVIVGFDQSVDYRSLSLASRAVRNGALFVATNNDPTYPTPDGLLPGAGAIVAAIATASGQEPIIAGKPHEPMRRLLRSKAGPDAWVIGDRVSTDIALAATEPGWRTILVRSGVTPHDADHGGADFLAVDLMEAVDVVLRGEAAR